MRQDESGLIKSNHAEVFQDFNNLLGICAHPLAIKNKIVEKSGDQSSDESDESTSEDKNNSEWMAISTLNFILPH